MVQVDQMAAHQVLGIFTAPDNFGGFFFRFASAAPNFQRGDDRNRLGLTYSPETAKFIDGSLSQLVQIVVIMVQDALAEFDGRFIVIARTYQDGYQFGIGQCAAALGA